MSVDLTITGQGILYWQYVISVLQLVVLAYIARRLK